MSHLTCSSFVTFHMSDFAAFFALVKNLLGGIFFTFITSSITAIGVGEGGGGIGHNVCEKVFIFLEKKTWIVL